jgi:hypothetical protein
MSHLPVENEDQSSRWLFLTMAFLGYAEDGRRGPSRTAGWRSASRTSPGLMDEPQIGSTCERRARRTGPHHRQLQRLRGEPIIPVLKPDPSTQGIVAQWR